MYFYIKKKEKNLYFVQVIRENMKDFLIFLDFLKILNSQDFEPRHE